MTAAIKGNWRPIETAPRDGTKILVWHPQVQGIALDRQAGAAVDEWKNGQWWRSYPAQQPTHWMHLPAPPLSALPPSMRGGTENAQ